MKTLRSMMTNESRVDEAYVADMQDIYDTESKVKKNCDKFTYKQLMHKDFTSPLMGPDDEFDDDVFKAAMRKTWEIINGAAWSLQDFILREGDKYKDPEIIADEIHDTFEDDLLGDVPLWDEEDNMKKCYVDAIYEAYPVMFKKATRMEFPVCLLITSKDVR